MTLNMVTCHGKIVNGEIFFLYNLSKRYICNKARIEKMYAACHRLQIAPLGHVTKVGAVQSLIWLDLVMGFSLG